MRAFPGHKRGRLTLNVRSTTGVGDRVGWNKRQKGRMERAGSLAPLLCVCTSVCAGAQPCMHVHVYTLLWGRQPLLYAPTTDAPASPQPHSQQKYRLKALKPRAKIIHSPWKLLLRKLGHRYSRLFNTRKLIFIIHISPPVHNHLYFILLNKHLRYNFYKASVILMKASEIRKQVILKLLSFEV